MKTGVQIIISTLDYNELNLYSTMFLQDELQSLQERTECIYDSLSELTHQMEAIEKELARRTKAGTL